LIGWLIAAEFFALALGADPTDRSAVEATVLHGCSLIVAKSPGAQPPNHLTHPFLLYLVAA
jgi:hypothetical protein